MSNYDKILEVRGYMDFIDDLTLSIPDKLILIAHIPKYQEERIAQLRILRSNNTISLAAKHVLMRYLITTIRKQANRYRRLSALV